MPDPRSLFLFVIFLHLLSFPEDHRAEAGTGTLIQAAPEPERKAPPGGDLVALAEHQEETAEGAAEKVVGEEQTHGPAARPIVEKTAHEPKATTKPTIMKPKSSSATSPVSSSSTPAAPLAPQKPPPTKQAAVEAVTPQMKGDENAAPSPQPSSLIRLLEEREDELMLWLAIAITFFIIGWICGGNFYLRRERRRSRKLRF
jgi:hypothetical protein